MKPVGILGSYLAVKVSAHNEYLKPSANLDYSSHQDRHLGCSICKPRPARGGVNVEPATHQVILSDAVSPARIISPRDLYYNLFYHSRDDH